MGQGAGAVAAGSPEGVATDARPPHAAAPDGRVRRDAATDENMGESHYTVRIRGDADTSRDRNGYKLGIGPGMTAVVTLLDDRRSVTAYLLTPITRLGESALRE